MRLARLALIALGIVGVAVVAGIAREAFSRSADGQERSAALFTQMMPVLQSPRCMNCHPATNFPRQGNDRHPHQMLVVRGPDNFGSPALQCAACHGKANNPNSGIPGAEDWHLAPLAMAWEGLTAGALCRLLLDPARNGHLSPESLIAHMRTPLVQWAWSPGVGLDGRPRSTPPSTSAAFVDLTSRWVTSGAACPDDK